MRHFVLIMVGLAGASALANGQSVRTLVTYKGPDPTTCAAPPLTQSFSSSDASVNAYFLLDGLSPGQTVELHWFDQTNAYKWYERWDPVPNGSSSRCYWVDLNIASYIAPSWGSWTVQVYVNDQAIGSAIGFQVSSGPVEPRGPEYVGYFDPIEPGCSHLTGWAKDNGNPNAVVSVDIRVEGGTPPFPVIQATEAGKSRSGVGNYEWNLYNLQLYEDGQSHLVHVLYHGSPQELPGSPRYFPPPGALSTCNGVVSPLIRVGHVVTLPNSNGTVYYVHSTGLYPFATADAFYSWGFQFSDVTTANSAEAALPIQTIIIPTKTPGCSDPISQIKGTCGSTPLSVSWVSGSDPPQTMMSGQSSQVKWQIAGPAQIQSRLCYGSSSDPATICQQTARDWQYAGTNTSGVFIDSIFAPTTSIQQTLYVVVQAQANGQTVYTQPTSSVTVRVPSPLSRNLWIYSSDSRALRSPVDPRLTDFIVVVEKLKAVESLPKFKYIVSVLADNLHELQAAFLTMVVSKDVNIDINSPTTYRLIDIPGGGVFDNILAKTDSGWEDLSIQQPLIDFGSGAATLLKDAIGFIPYVGTGQALIDGWGDAAALLRDSPTVVPTSDFTNKVRDINQYHKVNLAATKLRPPFWVSGSLVYAVRFTVIVDESNGRPLFFLRARNSHDKIIGLEFGNLQ